MPEYRFEKMPALPDAMRETIQRAVASAPPRCAGLIDPGRRIGDDPVGHACPNVATDRLAGLAWDGRMIFWRLCASCKGSLDAGETKVSLPPWKAVMGEDADA